MELMLALFVSCISLLWSWCVLQVGEGVVAGGSASDWCESNQHGLQGSPSKLGEKVQEECSMGGVNR